jgi:surface antigen
MLEKILKLATLFILTIPVDASGGQQCVTYARDITGFALKGDAWKWWKAADGLYRRGKVPREGSVLVFDTQGSMTSGHVAVVSMIGNTRDIKINHANWAPLHTTGRGLVSKTVPVKDVSWKNDWSQVRVWHHDSGGFGRRVYKTLGFIYPSGHHNQEMRTSVASGG